MAITNFDERPDSGETRGNPPTKTLRFTCYPTIDDDEVQVFAYGATPQTVASAYGTLYRQDIVAEKDGSDQYIVTVPYGPRQKIQGSFRLSFDTAGGTTTRSCSIGTVNSYKANGEPDNPPDYQGAIDVQDDGSIKGCEIVIPVFKLNCAFKHPAGVITLPQIQALARLVGTVNSSKFLGFDVGEVLILGVTGEEGTDTETTLQYQFGISEGLVNQTVAGFQNVTKDGWDYAWVKFAPAISGGFEIRKPRWLYIERVYYRKPFANILGFGGF